MGTSRPIAMVTALAAIAAAFLLSGSACTAFSADSGPTGMALDADATSDAAPPNDAPSSEDVVAPALPFCAAHAHDPGWVFCADFESPAQGADPFGFTDSAIAPTVTAISVVPDDDPGHGGALEVLVNGAISDSHNASVRRVLGTSASGPLPLQLDLDVKIMKNNASYATLAALHLAGSTCEASFGIGVFDGMTIGGTRNREMAMPNYDVGEWRHVTTVVTPSASSTTGFREQTTYDGASLVDRDARQSNGGAPTGCTSDDLVIGVSECGYGAAQVSVRFDNVLVRRVQ